MSEICPHGDLIEACVDCTVAPPTPRTTRPVRGRYALTATFPGQCPECDLPIVVGMRIVKMTNDTYRHFKCVDEYEVDQ